MGVNEGIFTLHRVIEKKKKQGKSKLAYFIRVNDYLPLI
jgi:hypothetical protein